MPASEDRAIVRFRDGVREETTDTVVAEEPMEIRLEAVPLAVLMRTPGHEEDLIRGFALTEGIVVHPHEIAGAHQLTGDDQGDRWELALAPGVAVDPEQFRRNVYTSASCGVCGKASIDAVRVAAPQPPAGPRVSVSLLIDLPDRLRASQPAFRETGGIHAAALFTADGELLELREDVGRHNAVDKVIGAVTATRWPLGELILLVSGRVSFEMVQKAAVAGIPFVCGISAASSLAADLGDQLSVTVIGFLRNNGFNVYAGGQRVAD